MVLEDSLLVLSVDVEVGDAVVAVGVGFDEAVLVVEVGPILRVLLEPRLDLELVVVLLEHHDAREIFTLGWRLAFALLDWRGLDVMLETGGRLGCVLDLIFFVPSRMIWLLFVLRDLLRRIEVDDWVFEGVVRVHDVHDILLSLGVQLRWILVASLLDVKFLVP